MLPVNSTFTIIVCSVFYKTYEQFNYEIIYIYGTSAGVSSITVTARSANVCAYGRPEKYYKVLRILCELSSFHLITNNIHIACNVRPIFCELIFRRIYVIFYVAIGICISLDYGFLNFSVRSPLYMYTFPVYP